MDSSRPLPRQSPHSENVRGRAAPSALPAARLRTYATAYAQVGWPHRTADGLCASREEAVAAFREAFDRVPDNTIDKTA